MVWVVVVYSSLVSLRVAREALFAFEHVARHVFVFAVHLGLLMAARAGAAEHFEAGAVGVADGASLVVDGAQRECVAGKRRGLPGEIAVALIALLAERR